MNPWMKVIAALLIAAAGYAVGHHLAAQAGETALAKNQSSWDAEKAQLASQRADAINARMIAEGEQADAINQAAANYAKGKADAEQNAKQAIADLDAGTRRLRNQWATCKATTAVLSSSPSGSKPDGEDGLREDGVRRVLSAVGRCQAQRDGLQQALIGERVGQ